MGDMSRDRHQLFSIPTYDAVFKWVLSQDSIRPSFFHAFIPDLKIQSSERLDDHMNPLKELQLLREFLHDKETDNSVKALKEASTFAVNIEKENKMVPSKEATHFLRKVVEGFDDFKFSFPNLPYDGTMDFVCKLDTGEYALVEMQVIPYDYWDQRALAYVAAFYGNQLRKGGAWHDIKRVIGINILGGGKDQTTHWKDTPDQFVRHYKMTEKLHKEGRIMEGIEIIQYSIMNAPKDIEDQETKDWLTFFQRAHLMTEEEVRTEIKTPAVLQAFERVRYDKLPGEVRIQYELEDKEYDRVSEYTKSKEESGRKQGIEQGMRQGIEQGIKQGMEQGIKQGVEQGIKQGIGQGIEQGIKKVAHQMLLEGLPIETISKVTGLSHNAIKTLS